MFSEGRKRVSWEQMGLILDNSINTFSSIDNRFDMEIPHQNFADISSIMKGKSTLKGLYRFNVDNSASIQLSKLMKYRRARQVVFSLLDVTLTPAFILCFDILLSSNLF